MKRIQWLFSSLRQHSRRLAHRGFFHATTVHRSQSLWRGRDVAAQVEPLEERSLLSVTWVPQGPTTSQNGQVEGIDDKEVIGAVHALLADPTDPNTMYVGAVNGGVWRTHNALAVDNEPTWTPLFDHFSSLSIGAMEMDPADHLRILVGIGKVSSLGNYGGDLTGVILTVNGGDSWTEIKDPLLLGKSVSGVAIRGDILLAATTTSAGLFRRANAGSNFVPISGTAESHLPSGRIFDLVGDPTSAGRFYVSVAQNGIYRSDDFGATWTSTAISANHVDFNAAITNSKNFKTEMAVANNGRIYVGVINDGRLAYVTYSDNHGDLNAGGASSWIKMDLPSLPGSTDTGIPSRSEHFSIAADPNDPNTVYIGGSTDRLFRGNTVVSATGSVPSPQWEPLTHRVADAPTSEGGTANGSAPHADSRDITFDANRQLIEADDGGIYRRTNPLNNTGDWFSMIGNLAITEMHSVAYDNNSNVLISGNQDTGTTYQLTPGGTIWNSLSVGDGGDVTVDNVTLAATNQSIRYTSSQKLAGFTLSVWDASNRRLENTDDYPANPALVLDSGASFDGLFINPVVLNAVNPSRLMLGGYSGLYESMNRGKNISQIGVGVITQNDFDGYAIAYGGRRLGVDNADVLYVAHGPQIYLRTTAGGVLTATADLPDVSAQVMDIALDPNDWMRAWAVDGSHVYQTTDAGATWSKLTTMGLDATDIRTIEYIAGPSEYIEEPSLDALVVGGLGGVFKATENNFSVWSKFGEGLPRVPIRDMQYNKADDVLVVGTFGRGAWMLSQTWATALGGGGNDVPVGIALAEDGGYAVVGTTKSLNGDSADVWLSRFDSRGNLMWTRTYAGSFSVQLTGAPNFSYQNFSFDEATDINATTDGGFVITGRSAFAPGNSSDGLVFRVNASGDVVGATLHSFAHGVSDALISVDNGGALVAGTVGISVEYPSPTITTYGGSSTLNINGTLYVGYNNGVIDFGNHALSQAIQTEDGGVAVIGSSYGGIYTNTYVGKKATGSSLVTGVTFGDGGEFGISITETPVDPAHPFAPRFIGTLSANIVLDINVPVTNFVRKLDATTLLPVWEVILDGSYAPGTPRGKIEALPDGGFLVATETEASSFYGVGSGSNILLTKLDADGHIVWTKVYGGKGTEGARFNGETLDLIVTPDGYAFTVATNSFGFEDGLTDTRDFWVVKTDLDGNIPVMTGLMRDVTSSATVTPYGSTIHANNLVALNPTQFAPLTDAERARGDYHPVIDSRLWGYGGTINDLSASAQNGFVPRVQSTPTYNAGAMQFAQAHYSTDESGAAFVPNESGLAFADVVVTRADATHGAYGRARVKYTVAPNDSTSNSEFVVTPFIFDTVPRYGFLDFEDGELSKTIRVRALTDNDYDLTDSITITLSDIDPLNDYVLGARTSTVVSFNNTTPFPGRAQFSASNYSLNEYKKTATITVNRVDGDGYLQVNYATVSGGTATAGNSGVAGSDYGSVTGTLSFTPGVTSRTFTIPLFDDAQTEGDETINLQLSNAVNGELGTPITATLTIHDVELPAPQTIAAKYNGKIAFSRDVGGSIQDIFVMNANGTGLANVTNTSLAGEYDVAWSPDGTKLAFTVFDFTDPNANSGIFVTNANGTGRTRLTTSINDRSPTWSPDGLRMAYVTQGQLVLMNANGSNADSLLSGSVSMPKWSPDGTHLIYQKTVGGLVKFFEIGVDGFGEHEVLSNFSAIYDYSYSPDGTQLILNGSLDGVQAIFRANLDGSGTPQKLIDVTYSDFSGLFSVGQSMLSPDGTRLVFVNLSSRIVASNVNGSSQLILTGDFTDSQPAWQPLLVDNVAPSIVSLTPSPTLITDADAGTATFTITVAFDEPMNTSIKPTLSFPNENPSATITLNTAQSVWTNSTTFVAKYDVGTAAAFLTNIDVQVSGAKDLAGNSQDVTQFNNRFNIDLDGPPDTTRPTLVSFTRFNPSQAVNTAPALVFRATFSETIDFTTIDTADFAVVGSTATVLFVNEVTDTGDGTVYEVAVTGGNLAALTTGTVGLNLRNTTNITDLAGNLLVIAEPTIDQLYSRGTPTPNRAPSFTKGANQTVLEDSGLKTVTRWATAISPGTGSSDAGQTVDFIVTNNNNTFFSVQPAIAPNGTLTFTLTADANGSATVSVKIHDDGGTAGGGVDTSAVQTFTIAITAVNDAPSFTLPNSTLTVLEDAVTQTVSNFVTSLGKGPANESAQTLSFVVTNDNAALFKTAPAISAAGVLTYTLNLDANGLAHVSVKIKDNGLVANGGVDTSAAQDFTINVTPVNDVPKFTKGADQSTNEDIAVTVGAWAKGISAGAVNESGQMLDFQVTNNNNALFAVQPTIGVNGALSYTPALNVSGTAIVTVRLHDNGGGTDLSAAQTFNIKINPLNDAPVRTAGTLPTINVDEDFATSTAVTLGLGSLTYAPGPVTATDEASQTLTYKITAIPKFITLAKSTGAAVALNGTVTASELQGLQYKTVLNLSGSDNLKFTVTDNGSGTLPNVNTLTETLLITVNSINDAPPTISDIVNQTTNEDTATAAIKFTVDDVDDKLVSLNAITVTAMSSNTTLVPNTSTNIVLGGSLGARTILLKPLADQNGTTTITVTARDSNGATSTDTFVLTVTAVNDAPRVTIATLTVPEFTTANTIVGTVTAIDPDMGDTVTAFTFLSGNTSNALKIDNAGVIRVNDANMLDFETATLRKFTLAISATDNRGLAGAASKIPAEFGPITINVTNQPFALTVPALDSDNTVTVLRVGNNLVARRGGVDLFTPTPLEDVTSLTITGGTAKDTVVLDVSLNTAGSAPHSFVGQILVNGNAGNDTLDASKITVTTFGITFNGGADNDTALGGSGNETLTGGDGNDSINGGAGNDLLTGGKGDDLLLGGAGNDTYAFADSDTSETDTLTEATNAGTDTLNFSTLTTAVTVDLNSETLLATHANRTIKTSATGLTKLAPNFENVIGGIADDNILGNAVANSLFGGSGNDTIRGGAGTDAIRGDDGNDQLNGDADNDMIIGGAGNDILHGDAANDTVIGGLGDDQVFGDAGTDVGLGGRGGPARGGTGAKDAGDVLNASLESINEAFATIFAFE